MKNLFTINIMAIVASAAIGWAGTTNPVSARLSEAGSRGDVASIIALLPEVEQLWPREPQGYYEALHTAARTLEPVWRTNPGAQRALNSVFTNALQKSCPSGMEAELSCLEAKWNIAMVSINMIIESGQPATVSALAQYLGEVRQRKIPNYTNRATKQPPAAKAVLDRAGVFDPASLKKAEDRAEYEKVMEENRRELHMNDVQSLLWRIDQALTSRLLQACARFSSSDGKNAAFLDQVASAARLTAAERKGL
jgi:hypothetical protein